MIAQIFLSLYNSRAAGQINIFFTLGEDEILSCHIARVGEATHLKFPY